MKLRQEEITLFKESHFKWLSESNFLARLFAKRVKRSVEKNTDIKKAVADADKSLEKSRVKIEKALDGSKEKIKDTIPADVRKYLGFDY